MAYIHNALPYKQKQVLPLMLPSTTHPTTIIRFQISLDTSQDAFNLGHQSFKTVRMISNNNFLDKPKQYQSSLSPNVCLPYNKSQPRLLNSNNQKVQHYTVFALFADWVTLALLFFLAAFAVEDMAFSNSLCCLSVNSFLFCPIFSKVCIACSRLVLAVSSIVVATLTKSIEKVWARVSEENHL